MSGISKIKTTIILIYKTKHTYIIVYMHTSTPSSDLVDHHGECNSGINEQQEEAKEEVEADEHYVGCGGRLE